MNTLSTVSFAIPDGTTPNNTYAVAQEVWQDVNPVAYLGHFGSDLSVAQAAWVSTNKAEKKTQADAERLVKYLAKHGHWTPFGQTLVQLEFHIPIFVARQLMRHNIGIVWNEVSRRYVNEDPSFYVPDMYRKASPSIKQGSLDELVDKDDFEYVEHINFMAAMWGAVGYYDLLYCGVCPEQARMVLPQSTMTRIRGAFSLASLARVYNLRVDKHAQVEIQNIAHWIDHIVTEQIPDFKVSWASLKDTKQSPNETNGSPMGSSPSPTP